MSKNISIANVLRALSDQKTQTLLNAIIESEAAQSQLLLVQLRLSRRQYYNRITDLVAAGLIRGREENTGIHPLGR